MYLSLIHVRFSESKKIQKEQNYLVNSFPPSHKIEKNRLTLKTPLPSWRVKTAFFGWVHEYYPMHVAKWLSAGREITFWSGSLQILCEICFLCWIEIFGRRRWTSSELMVKSGTDYISCLPNKPKSRSVGQRSEQRWPVIIDLCSKIEKVKTFEITCLSLMNFFCNVTLTLYVKTKYILWSKSHWTSELG